MDSFGKIVSIFLVVILIFIMPIYYIAIKQDSINQNYVNKETLDFVSTIRETGQITKDTYNRFMKKLDVTGNLYDIEIEHQHMVINPLIDDDGNVVEEEVISTYENVYKEDIIKTLFEGTGTYEMRKDDYISVSVKNKNKTLATRLQETFYQREMPTVQIVATFGGVIRDEN